MITPLVSSNSSYPLTGCLCLFSSHGIRGVHFVLLYVLIFLVPLVSTPVVCRRDLFMKLAVCTKFDIYLFIKMTLCWWAKLIPNGIIRLVVSASALA
jgi:hypothetical protein